MRMLVLVVLVTPLAGLAQRAPARPASVARGASAMTSPAPRPVDATARALSERITTALDDTSMGRRDRAISAIRRAPVTARSVAVRAFAGALTAAVPSTASRERRARALMALGQLVVETQGDVGHFDSGADLAPAIPAVVRIASDPEDPLRSAALLLLAEAGRSARAQSLPVARAAAADGSPEVREGALAVLGAAGDSTDLPRAAAALNDSYLAVRLRGARLIGELGRREGVPFLENALADTSRALRAAALQALARMGPTARAALPKVAALVTDTTDWRGGASYTETIGAEAAWAATRIAPRRGVAMIPARVAIDDRESSLRSDGLGEYVAGADSIKAFASAALNLDLSGARGDGRTTKLIADRPLRRSLRIDLTRPAAGAKPIGVVRDNEAIIHVYWRREPGKRMTSITTLDPADRPAESERAEIAFRIGGEPYLLQMGDWVAAELDPRAPKVNGKGTQPPHIWHLAADEWTVVAPPGSLARLWDLSDPAKPVDKGLYRFSFSISWSAVLPR